MRRTSFGSRRSIRKAATGRSKRRAADRSDSELEWTSAGGQVTMFKISFLSCTLAASLGCSSGATPSFHPSAPGGVPLSQLSSDQVHTVCVEQIEYLLMLVRTPAGRETFCRSAGKDAAMKALVQVGTPTDAALQ